MVYKLLLKYLIVFIFFLLPLNLYSNIIYDKNNIIITKIDLDNYKQLYFENHGIDINNSTAIKNIVIIKNVIEHFEENNSKFLERLDEVLTLEIGEGMMDQPIVRDYMRYFKIRNEFIIEFYNTKFKINDLEKVFNLYEKIELPISDNNCLTIIKLEDFKNNNEFISNFYKNLREGKREFMTLIDDVEYDICIDSNTYQMIEKEILNYIEFETKKDFEKFIYDQQK